MRVRGRLAISPSKLDRGLGLSQGLRALHEIGVTKSALRLEAVAHLEQACGQRRLGQSLRFGEKGWSEAGKRVGVFGRTAEQLVERTQILGNHAYALAVEPGAHLNLQRNAEPRALVTSRWNPLVS